MEQSAKSTLVMIGLMVSSVVSPLEQETVMQSPRWCVVDTEDERDRNIQKIAELEAAGVELSKEIAGYLEQVSVLQRNLTAANEMYAQLQDRSDLNDKYIIDLQGQVDFANEQRCVESAQLNAQLSQLTDNHTKAIAALEAQIKAADDEVAKNAQAKIRLETQIKDLNVIKARCTQEIAAAQAELNTATAKLERIQAKYEQIAAELKNVKDANAKDVAILEAKYEQIAAELNAAKVTNAQAIAILKVKLANLDNKNAELASLNERFVAAKEELQAANKQLLADNEELSADNTKYRKNIAAHLAYAAQEHLDAQGLVTEYRKNIAAHLAYAALGYRENRALNDELNNANDKNADLDQKNTEIEQKLRELNDQQVKLQTKLDDTTKQKDKEVAELQLKHDKVAAELNATKDTSSQEVTKLQKQIKELNDQKVTLQAAKTDLDAKHQQALKEKAEALTETAKKSKTIADLTEKHDLSTMILKIMPLPVALSKPFNLMTAPEAVKKMFEYDQNVAQAEVENEKKLAIEWGNTVKVQQDAQKAAQKKYDQDYQEARLKLIDARSELVELPIALDTLTVTIKSPVPKELGKLQYRYEFKDFSYNSQSAQIAQFPKSRITTELFQKPAQNACVTQLIEISGALSKYCAAGNTLTGAGGTYITPAQRHEQVKVYCNSLVKLYFPDFVAPAHNTQPYFKNLNELVKAIIAADDAYVEIETTDKTVLDQTITKHQQAIKAAQTTYDTKLKTYKDNAPQRRVDFFNANCKAEMRSAGAI